MAYRTTDASSTRSTAAMAAGSFPQTDAQRDPIEAAYARRTTDTPIVVFERALSPKPQQLNAHEATAKLEQKDAARLSSALTLTIRELITPAIDSTALQALVYEPPKIEFTAKQLQSMVVLKPDAAGTSVNQQAADDEQACCNCCSIL